MLIKTSRVGIGDEWWITNRELQRNDVVSLPGGIKARIFNLRHGESKFFCVEVDGSVSPGKIRKVRKSRRDITVVKEIK
jgi:hypothetical protein